MPTIGPDSDSPRPGYTDAGRRHRPISFREAIVASELTEAMVVNGIVLATVLATDLGPTRKIGLMRIARPIIAAAVIIPLFISRPVGHGTGLAIELAGVAAGVLAGLAVAAQMHVRRDPGTGAPVSRAGAGYAALWIGIIGARAAFSYGVVHWFNGPIVAWAVANDVSAAAITDALIFMAVVMVVVRTAVLAIRAARLPQAAPAEQVCAAD
jgi:hypothetical protein